MMVKYKPMLTPPVPWQNCRRGGHLTVYSDVLRVPFGGREQVKMLRAADDYASKHGNQGGCQEVQPCHHFTS